MIVAIDCRKMKPDTVEVNKHMDIWELEFTEIMSQSGFIFDFTEKHLEYIHEAIEIALGMKPSPCDCCNKNDVDTEKIACLNCEEK